MAKAAKVTETKIVVTGIELSLTEEEAAGLLTLLYRGTSMGALEDLDLNGVQHALFAAGVETNDVSFTRPAHTRSF